MKYTRFFEIKDMLGGRDAVIDLLFMVIQKLHIFTVDF